MVVYLRGATDEHVRTKQRSEDMSDIQLRLVTRIRRGWVNAQMQKLYADLRRARKRDRIAMMDRAVKQIADHAVKDVKAQ